MKAWGVVGVAGASAAVAGVIVAVGLGGRPGHVAAQVQPPAAERGSSQIHEGMWARTVKFKVKDEDREFTATAFRRVGPAGIAYFIEVTIELNNPFLDIKKHAFNLTADDASKLAAFCERPMGDLPAGAAEGEKAIGIRRWISSDIFGGEAFTLELWYYPGTNAFTAGRKGNVWVEAPFDAARWVEAIRAAEKDLATLKSHPAKW